MEKYTLKNPIDFNGKTYTEVEMDLNSLSKADFERCERAVKKQLRQGEYIPGIIEGDKRYAIAVASRAAGLPPVFFEELRGADYSRLCTFVTSFLMSGESDMEDEDYMEIIGAKPQTKQKASHTSTA